MSEVELGMVVASGLISVGYYSWLSCFGSKRKLHKERLCSLVLGKHTGKSRLKESLSSVSKNLVIVDVFDEVEKEGNKLNYLISCRDYVKKLLKEYPKSRFLLLVENKEQSEYFGVSDSNCFVCCPSNKLFKTLLDNLTPTSTELKEQMEVSRMELVRATQEDKLNIYSSFDELYNVIKTAYRLQPNF